MDVKEIKDKAILDAPMTLVNEARSKARAPAPDRRPRRRALRIEQHDRVPYRLRNAPMKIADKSFTADGVEFPAGSFVIARR